MTTRRTFLGRTAGALAAFTLPLDWRKLSPSATAADYLPTIDEAALRAYALAAIDRARAAGAKYADVRVSAGQRIAISSSWSRSGDSPLVPMMYPVGIRLGTGIGVRALVDGAWGFSGSDVVDGNTVDACAKAAAGLARGNRRPGEAPIVLADAGIARTAEWATPILKNPFDVTISEQAYAQLDAISQAMRVHGTESASLLFDWARSVRIFASTDGAVLTQRFVYALPIGSTRAVARDAAGQWGQASAEPSGLNSGGYGWEAVHADKLNELMRTAAEAAVASARRTTLEAKSVEVGRYDLVLSGAAVSTQLGLTLGGALDAERALGFHANDVGTSFAAPPLDMLGKYQIAAPSVTIRADRTARDGLATVGFDDEGVPATSATLVERGLITDYLTSREAAVELAPWYTQQKRPVRSNGCMRGTGPLAPMIAQPNLTLEGAASGPSLDEIIASTKRGYFVSTAGGAGDQQLFSNQFSTGPEFVREIRNGKLGAPAGYFGAQFVTPVFWRNLDALGNPKGSETTMGRSDNRLDPNDPIQWCWHTLRAVPARFRQVSVLNIGRTA